MVILTVLSCTVGVALLVIGRFAYASAAFGSALGCGSNSVGMWIQYRRNQRAEDPMSQPGWTWLDILAGGLGMIGIAMLSTLAKFSGVATDRVSPSLEPAEVGPTRGLF